MKWTGRLILCCALVAGGTLRGGETPASLEAWIPDNVVGYLTVRDLGPRLEAFLASDLFEEIERLDLIGKVTREGGGRRLRDGLQKFRAVTGLEPLEVVRRGFAREVVAALRVGFAGPELVLMTRGKSPDELERLLQEIRGGVGEHLGQIPEGERTAYRDRAIETFDDVSVVVIGEVLIASNSRRLLESVLDLATGGADNSVARSPVFAGVRQADAGSGFASLVMRPRFVPGYEIPLKLDDPVSSLLVQGVFGCLEKSDLLAVDLNVVAGELSIDVRSTLQKDGLAARYESFFPDSAPSRLAAGLRKRGVLASVSLRRDLAKWWAERENLLESSAVGGLLQFEQIMGIIFGGKSFGEEILPHFRDEILFVARNQKYGDLEAPPDPSLPGFAVVFEIRGAADFENSLVGAFQTIVGLINADRAQKKKSDGIMMLLATEKVSGRELYTVKLNPPASGEAAGLVHNFTPSFAVAGERVVISSSRELARLVMEEIVSLAERAAPGDEERSTTEGARRGRPQGDAVTIEGAQLLSLLEENEEFLVSDVMLKKGRTKKEAEGEIAPLIALVRHLRDARLRLQKEDGWAGLRLRVRLSRVRAGKPPEPEVPETVEERRL